MAKVKKTKAAPAAPPFEAVAGDCVAVLPERFAGKDRPKVDLLVADPPYNYGQSYDKYEDHQPFDAYLDWSYAWLEAAHRAMDPHGSAWLFYPDELVSFVDVYCQTRLGWHKRAHVVWHYTFGVCNAGGKNFSRSHAHALYYSMKKTRFTFDASAIRVPSARQLVYNDRRQDPRGKVPDDTWVLLKSQMEEVLTPDQDTWLFNRVCGTYKEKASTPNQLPLAMLERIVLSTSKPGDLVADPFLGSGTTLVAAVRHGRRGFGCDVSEAYVAAARERIARELHPA